MSEDGRERQGDDAGQGAILWRPTPDEREHSPLAGFAAWLGERGLRFEDYDSLWRWSTDEIEAFWGAVWEYFDSSIGRASSAAPRSTPSCRTCSSHVESAGSARR